MVPGQLRAVARAGHTAAAPGRRVSGQSRPEARRVRQLGALALISTIACRGKVAGAWPILNVPLARQVSSAGAVSSWTELGDAPWAALVTASKPLQPPRSVTRIVPSFQLQLAAASGLALGPPLATKPDRPVMSSLLMRGCVHPTGLRRQ